VPLTIIVSAREYGGSALDTEEKGAKTKSEVCLALIRVLLVEDFLPFRNFICSKLEENPELEVISQVSDGQDAVQKAKELKPELILLDIGLPTLNGIAVARQVRDLVPNSKIIFVSQESSPDVVQEALNTGALGYVLKTKAALDLLRAVDAALQGKNFVSSGLQISLPQP
jgi:DNA-binding NarL/FixJ family response regulator